MSRSIFVNPSTLEDLYSSDTYKACFAECVAVALLVIIVGGATAGSQEAVSQLAFSLSYGFATSALTFSTSYVSGGHLSPGISFAHFLLRRMSSFKLISYWISQFVGGAIGAVILFASIPAESWKKPFLVATVPATSNTITALAWELMTSFMVTFVFLNVMDDIKRIGKYGPISVGLAFSAATLAGGSFSGASLNPAARSLNLQLASGDGVKETVWIYFLASLCSGSIAALATKVMRPTKEKLLRDLSHPDYSAYDASAQDFTYDFHR